MHLDIHPFISSFTGAGSFYNELPPQLITYKEKYKGVDKITGISPWMKRCLDNFENIARIQYQDNLRLVDNERLVNGEFLPNDYIEKCEDCEENFLDPIHELTKDGLLPSFVKHYDMIGTVIKTQVQEFTQLPDNFVIKSDSEVIDSEIEELKKHKIIEFLNDKLEERFERLKMLAGLEEPQVDPNDPNSQQVIEQYQQLVQKLEEDNTPEELQKIFKYSFKHFAIEWAEHELEDQKLKFNLQKLRRKEYYYYITVGRRFREITINYRGLNVNTLNYVNVFFQKSPNIEYVQDGDYAGTIDLYSAADIINKYGPSLSADQIKTFENYSTYRTDDKPGTDLFGNTVNYLGTDGNPYNTILPSSSPFLNSVAPNLGMNWFNVNGLLGSQEGSTRKFLATDVYWRSFKKVGRLYWINPETELEEVTLIDEFFIVPDYVKEIYNSNFLNSQDVNTIVWTWEEEIWQGTKINHLGTLDNRTHNNQPIYVNVGPCEYQSVSRYNFNRKKLPIAGQIANNINTKSTGQVDILKPYQFMFNIAMNKAFKYMERAFMSFVAFDVRNLPSFKDHEGEDAVFKFLDGIANTGIGLMETAPSMTMGANAGGQFPRVIDIDDSPKIIQHLNIANSIKQLGLSQLGFSPQRLGDIQGIDTATGINTAVTKSWNATSYWATDFWECEQDILKMQLDAAQWIQTKKGDLSSYVSKGIISESYLLINNNDFSLYDLKVYVSNLQEDIRQLELYRKLAVENNTLPTSMSTRMSMVSLNSAELIQKIVKEEEEKALKLQQEMRALQQQEIQSQNQIEQDKLAFQKEALYAKLQNNLQESWIRSRGYLNEGEQDLDKSNIPDAFEYDKFTLNAQNNLEKLGVSKDKLELEKQREFNRRLEEERKMQIELEKLNFKRQEMLQKAQNVKYLDKGKYNK